MKEYLSNIISAVKRARKGIILTLVEDVVIPWYRTNGDEAEYVAIETRHHVADRVHEALGGLVWAVRDHAGIAEAEYVVYAVEPVVAEYGGYTLMISIRQKDAAEPEDQNASEAHAPTEMPLHAFLQTFEPIGEIGFAEYNS